MGSEVVCFFSKHTQDFGPCSPDNDISTCLVPETLSGFVLNGFVEETLLEHLQLRLKVHGHDQAEIFDDRPREMLGLCSQHKLVVVCCGCGKVKPQRTTGDRKPQPRHAEFFHMSSSIHGL